MTTTGTPIYLSPVTAATFSITITATARLPRSRRRRVLVVLGGRQALHGLTTTATAGSIFLWAAMLSGISKPAQSTVAIFGPAIEPIAIRTISRVLRTYFITNVQMARLKM